MPTLSEVLSVVAVSVNYNQPAGGICVGDPACSPGRVASVSDVSPPSEPVDCAALVDPSCRTVPVAEAPAAGGA